MGAGIMRRKVRSRLGWVVVAVLISHAGRSPAGEVWRVEGGTATLQLDAQDQNASHVRTGNPAPRADAAARAEREFVIPIERRSTLTFEVTTSGVKLIPEGRVFCSGQLRLPSRMGDVALAGLAFSPGVNGELEGARVSSDEPRGGGFVLERVKAGFDPITGMLIIHADIVRPSAVTARALGDDALAAVDLGRLTLQATAGWVGGDAPAYAFPDPAPADGDRNVGADMTFCQLYSLTQYGRLGDTVGLAVATTSWNIGDRDISWKPMPDVHHPFIAMNLYRLKQGHFEQIGQSWVKHAFYALGNTQCGGSCTFESGHYAGEWLGIGCTDTYSAPLNGAQSGMGPRYEVNPWTGGWTYAGSHNSVGTHAHNAIEHRMQVQDSDLDSAQNAGAYYYVEGYYAIAEDVDVMNSAAWKPLVVNGAPGGTWTFGMSSAGSMPTAGFALDAWTGARQTVIAQETPPVEFVSPDGRCLLATKVTQVGADVWHYAYALLNIDMDRQVGAFSVPLANGAHVASIGFHAVRHHDEPWNAVGGVAIDNAPWTAQVTAAAVTFSTTTNPLRWGTLYNFSFDADAGPGDCTATLGLFKPGTPATVAGQTDGPVGSPPECGNGRVEGNEECDPPNGTTCDPQCQRIPLCGDGWLDGSEACDPPDGLHCSPECAWICGDGTIQSGEECDPPDGVACDASCQIIIVCGNGAVQEGEQCDDGNVLGGDGCSATCQFEYHDNCFQAGLVSDGIYSFDTSAANVDGPAHEACSTPGGYTYFDIWYRVAPSCTGDMTVSLCNSSFDTNLLIYEGCTCPVTDDELLACADSGCGPDHPMILRSRATVPVVAGHCYLVRIGGGFYGERGPGEMVITCDPTQADPLRGGLLWDRWWSVNHTPEPSGVHPLYPPAGPQGGSTTYRCVECHGWDYRGAAGAYASGSHHTGIKGVFGSTMSAGAMFDLIKFDVPPYGHGYAALGLNDYDIRDLVAFLQTQLVDTSAYIDSNGVFRGDAEWGQVHYELEGGANERCIDCHGFDGTLRNFAGVPFPAWVGSVADAEPARLLHKIRFGEPGAPMPSWLASGHTTQQAADIGRYAQSLPARCLTDAHCDDGDFCNGEESCADDACLAGAAPPCSAGCIDCNSNGVDDRCDPPGDFNLDGAVGLDDFSRLIACLTPCCPQAACAPYLYADDCCALVDRDRDGDVDLADVAAFEQAFGPGEAP